MEEHSNLPTHLVAIPDGNRRWARGKGLHPWEGHREGMKRFREVKSAVFAAGIPYFTFWGASYDNLTKRAKMEVKVLVSLFKKELEEELKKKDFVRDETRVRILGEWDEIIKDKKLKGLVDKLEHESAGFSKNNFTFLIGYDGRREMAEAIKKLQISKFKSQIDYDVVKSALWTGELPPVDFVIRTGGEPHWSAGFMMWLTANSQFYFTEKCWPAFGEKELKVALRDYARRGRRFGK